MGAALLADIGGTYARLALLRGGTVGEIRRMAVAEHDSLESAIRIFLADHRPAVAVDRAAIAVAGPVEGGEAALTNAPWAVSAKALGYAFGLQPVVLLNDFAALALALPRLAPDDLSPVGGGTAAPGAPMAVLGPGTGLGVAGLIPAHPAPLPLVTEGGHATLPAADARDAAILALLRERHGHVSAERVLSGDGLAALHGVLAELAGRPSEPDVTSAALVDAVLAGDDPAAEETLDVFCAFLGSVAGNVALTLGARGGVFIAGGIAPRIPDALARSPFRERFEAKGRMRDYLARIPTRVIVRPHPAFLGLAAALGE